VRKIVYLSGPLSNGGKLSIEHQFGNAKVACSYANELINAGFSVINPHLTVWQQDLFPQPYDVWMEVDYPLLLAADCVLRFPGKSKGADKECLWAIDNDKPVYTTIRDLILGEA
jgi:hypothetical protein